VFQTLDLSYANRVLTMIGVVPQWIRLLLWPARLTTEYAPPDIDIAQGPSLVQLPGLLMLVGILGLAVVLSKRGRLGAIASFGIAWFCITLLPSSNFIIPAGIIIAERTLFLPSLGALLAIGACAVWIAQRIAESRSFALRRNLSVMASASLAIILVAGAARSFSRTLVWHDNDRLLTEGIVDAPESYRVYYMLGAREFDAGDERSGERAYRYALRLFPYDPYMAYNFAMQYQLRGTYEAAIPLYEWAFALDPKLRGGQGRGNLALCYANANQPAKAREQALLAMAYGGAPLWQLRRLLQYSDSLLGKREATRRANSLSSDQMAALIGNSPLQSQNTAAQPALLARSAVLTAPSARH
jgi:tetratricopeptide (TPR) repeat protein